jgi:hypothetical protein
VTAFATAFLVPQPERMFEPSAVATFAPRSLSALVTELATTKERIVNLDAVLAHRDPTADEDRLWDLLTDHQRELEQGIRQAILIATGVSFDRIEGVLN